MKRGYNGDGTNFGKAAMAAAAALALALGSTVPVVALADDGGNQSQPPAVAQSDGSEDEGAWDATADEGGFSEDAGAYADEVGAQGASNANGALDSSWWWRRVSPSDALSSAQAYFGLRSFDDWDWQVGRFRGTPAYRVVIDVDNGWYWRDGQGLDPAGGADDNGIQYFYGRGGRVPGSMTTRYVAFVNYFTGRLIDGYVDYR